MQHKPSAVSSLLEQLQASLDDLAHASHAAATFALMVARALEHRETTESARLEDRGERSEGGLVASSTLRIGETYTELPAPPSWPGSDWCDDEQCHICEERWERGERPSVEADVPVRRAHELVAIDGIPAATYPFLPTLSSYVRPECSLVTFPAIEQPSVADNKDRCD